MRTEAKAEIKRSRNQRMAPEDLREELAAGIGAAWLGGGLGAI